jgi:hypothetical protein
MSYSAAWVVFKKVLEQATLFDSGNQGCNGRKRPAGDIIDMDQPVRSSGPVRTMSKSKAQSTELRSIKCAMQWSSLEKRRHPPLRMSS